MIDACRVGNGRFDGNLILFGASLARFNSQGKALSRIESRSVKCNDRPKKPKITWSQNYPAVRRSTSRAEGD